MNMYKTKTFLRTAASAALIFGISDMAAAQDASQEALPFIRISRDPVSAAMGFAGAASTGSTAYAAFGNPAVIPFGEKTFEAGTSWQRWAPDGAKSSNLAAGVSFKPAGGIFGFSLGAALQKGEEYSLAGADPASSFAPKDIVVNAGGAVRITGRLAVGVNLRYARQDLAEDASYSSFGADLMLLYRLSENLRLAAGVVSVGEPVKGGNHRTYDLPSSTKVAADYTYNINGDHALKAGLDIDLFFSGKTTAALGAQYSFKDMLFARAGYHLGGKDSVLPSFVTLGAGLKLHGVSLDLAFLTANDIIGNTLTIGLGYSF